MATQYWQLAYSGSWIPFSADDAFNEKKAILGYSRESNRAFYEDVKEGDVILIRRNSNYNVEVLYAGIAKCLHENDSNLDGRSYWTLSYVTKDFNKKLEEAIKANAENLPGGNSSNPLGPMKSFCSVGYSGGSKTIEKILQEIKNMSACTIICDRLKASHNIILHGAPGTGKTYRARKTGRMMNNLPDDADDIYTDMIQFHPSFDYADFIEGLKPSSVSDNCIGFRYVPGILKRVCAKAIKDPDHSYTLIIDEINRGDISRIFGEAFYSIDEGYRDSKERIETQYQALSDEDDIFHDGFYVPSNLYIIGTMNDIDKGVEAMDFAIRRRFMWIEISADESKDIINSLPVDNIEKEKAIDAMDKLNNLIETALGKQYCIGGAYFLKIGHESLEEIWDYRIGPLVEEYCRGTEHMPSEFRNAVIG